MAEKKITKQTNQAQIDAARRAEAERPAKLAEQQAKLPVVKEALATAQSAAKTKTADVIFNKALAGLPSSYDKSTDVAKGMAAMSARYGLQGAALNAYTGENIGYNISEQTKAEQGAVTGTENLITQYSTPINIPDPIYETITEQYTSPEEIQAMINAALATQQAKFDALTKQAAADKEAALVATRTKAKDKLTAMLAPYKLEGIASYIDAEIMKDTSEEMILLGLYDQPAYKTRFPGMDALRKAGRVISEKEYSSIENAMMQTARFFDLPKGFYDGSEDFGNLIGKQVSAKEYQDRLQIGQDLARTLNSGIKTQLLNLYNVGEGDLTAYVLDPDKALSLIQKQAKAATFVSLGRAAGFGLPSITAGQAENIVATEPYAKLTESQMQTKLGQAGELLKEQQRLSQIEGMTYSEQEALDAVISGDTKAVLASQQRAQREIARFSSRGGITGSSLGSSINV